ncbi:MAG: hypothetical protein AB7P24_01510 [Nitrospira sp.]
MRMFLACLLFVFGTGFGVAGAQDTASPVAGKLWRFEARYQLELIEVKARDETGVDVFGSDEILVVATLDSVRDIGSYTLWIEKGLADMDSDETVKIGEGNACLLLAVDDVRDGKWSCAETGHPTPFTLTFTVLEKDGVGRTIWELVTGSGHGFCVGGSQGDISKNCLSGAADEFNSVGSVRKVYTSEDLAGLAVGQTRQDSLVVDYCSRTLTIDGGTCGSARSLSDIELSAPCLSLLSRCSLL